MRSAYLSLGVDSDAEAERIYAALADGGTIFMPMQETFFASRFAQLRRSVRHQLDDRPRLTDAAAAVIFYSSRAEGDAGLTSRNPR